MTTEQLWDSVKIDNIEPTGEGLIIVEGGWMYFETINGIRTVTTWYGDSEFLQRMENEPRILDGV